MKTFAIITAALLLTACAGTTNPMQHKPANSQKAHTQPNSQPNRPHGHAMPRTATLTSKYTFNDTINRLQAAIASKGMTIFAVIDHAAAAQGAGLNMQPATVIIYGTPKAGTPLMVKDPTFALQLPLKVLVTEVNNEVQVSYTPSDVVVQGSKITPNEVANTLAAAEKLIAATVQ
ncbi:MAG: DUF302 domain-containing protein [Moraxella sp.]|nr:DUF302 domain-containing protein [Moraxella sp.]